MIIQHNLSALQATNLFHKNVKLKTKTMEKLSSGYSVNRAADDAAALRITEKMRNQIRGLNRSVQNVEEGISYVQVADGALSEIHSMLHRIEELAVQAANDTNAPEDRISIDHEVQNLKEEIERVLEITEFNGLKIWDTDLPNRVQIGTERRQALTINSSSATVYMTEANKDKVSANRYTIRVVGTDETDVANYGFQIQWSAWNGQDYSSQLIGWDSVNVGDKLSFKMNLKDYIDTNANPELEGIDFPISWKMEEAATLEDVAAAIDGVSFAANTYSAESVSVSTGVAGVSFSVSTNYLTELASDRNAEAYDTAWIEPASGGANVTTFPTYTDPHEDTGFEIKFDIKNVGTATATSTNVYYYSNERTPETENLWWRWAKRADGSQYQTQLTHNPTEGIPGSLQNIIDAITDGDGSGNSLTQNSSIGGTIRVSFAIKMDSGNVSYGGSSSSEVGTLDMSISVYDTDTEETLMQRIQSALNENTIFDIYEGNAGTNAASRIYQNISSSSAKSRVIDAPIYKSVHDLVIQSGANSGDTMHIVYDSLRLRQLNLEDAQVLDHQSASETIAAVQGAVKTISAQRSLFGAYANRMEHTIQINENYAENLQTAESGMRDTDMAEEIMKNAKLSILQQSAQTMISNANRQKDIVLQLLQ